MTHIRRLAASDWPAIEAIFVEGIATRNATFETQPPTWGSFDDGHLTGHRLVAEDDGDVVGWAVLAATSDRACYAGVVESSVYVAAVARGRGLGRALMERLIESAQRDGIWTIQAAMFPENEASVALHERLGFRVVGRRERIAELEGVWRDTVLLELRL